MHLKTILTLALLLIGYIFAAQELLTSNKTVMVVRGGLPTQGQYAVTTLQDTADASVFRIKEDFKSFTHKTPEALSIYTVADTSYFVKERDQWKASVRSETGYIYYYVFDFRLKRVKIMFDRDKDTYLITYKYK